MTAESLFAHALVRADHKGLFFDRLDLGIVDGTTLEESPRLAVGADVLGYARNRVYSPRLGRWVQRDPNASGATVLQSAQHGLGLMAMCDVLDLRSAQGDGANLHSYLGSAPWGRGVPTGLWLVDLASLGVDVVHKGIGGGLESMVGEYSDNMEYDLDWALDWSQADDWHSRSDGSWVGEAFNEGLSAGVQEALWDFVDPFGIRDFLADGSFLRTVYKVGGASQKGVRALRAVRSGRLHHVWPKYLARVTGTNSQVLAKLPQGMHQRYHNHVSHGMKNGRLGTPLMNARRAEWDDWMKRQRLAGKSDAQILDELGSELTRLTKQFERNESISGLVDALKGALRFTD